MDWKYKHFHQERIYTAPRDLVLEAARSFFTESLGWQVTDATEGLTAQGYSFSHGANALLRIQSTAGGTKVTIDLAVSRAGASGFMLFDVGGYYNRQIRKWLDGIQWSIHQKLTPGQADSANPHMPASHKGAACLFNGCLVFVVAMFALYFVVTFICALVGLITGHLYLWGKGGTLVVEGLWGRLVSALILLFGGFLVWRIRRQLSRRASSSE